MSISKKASLAVILSTMVLSPLAVASHHFENAQSIQTPTLNQLDNFVFPSSTAGYTTLVMTVNNAPTIGAGGVFNPDALYNIHIAESADYKQGKTFTFKFDKQGNVTVYQQNTADSPVGATGEMLGKGAAHQGVMLGNGLKIWTGAAQDPFTGNSPGLHQFRKDLAQGKYDPTVWKSTQGKNIFAARNCGAIVLDVPNKLLAAKISVYMTTDFHSNNVWKQVQYSANPLFSHIMLFENAALKREHDESRPQNSDDMKNFVSARTARASAMAHSQAAPFVYGDKVAKMLVPDVLTYQVGEKAVFSAEKRNGRSLDDDAMSAMLSLLIGQPTDQAVASLKRYSQDFPYVIPVTLK
ncbi:DUF4331 family protein [Scandinavium sp. V105_16]|uniref:DUF4331 family protein n=1 Tax=Scandinavium lactucae TaxID=3095028 RepID=A0AAJ2S6Q8_9ENTR|nr:MULTISPECIES: DUF4331 family protein [unclassified Scandinavium]MDX6021103.1 DUF4331 family protein [Scandinavium sp. V105_16]MDX6031094.1 DUF4331 family protein [Scandinavium sp. V105_12]MDX6041616.1 DUF4331 family protein [Scandinavium sp. V105_6]MDX6049537.1 DUF4331 family protein [Scandinavium sp. V105_1]